MSIGSRSTLSLLLLWTPLAVACGERTDTRAYVEMLGVDTTAVEVFTRSADRIDGAFVMRIPVTRLARYTAHLAPDGSVRRLEVIWTTPEENPEGPPTQRSVIEIVGDSATFEVEEDLGVETRQMEVPTNTLPSTGKVPLSVGLFEQAARQAGAAGGERWEFAILRPSSRRGAAPNAIEARGADSVSMEFFGNPMIAALDTEGRILGITGRETTMKVEIQRVDPAELDLEALAAEFAARDARGEGFGQASPQESVTASVDSATLEVEYSRPSKRGREIFGGLVPWNEVWRTGANAATHFATDHDLVIGGELVPAGTYTLWTTYTPESAELIISSLTQIWGTAYDPAGDFVRIPMAREQLLETVERFTIEVEPTDGGSGVLALSWDTSRFTVPIEVSGP
ncbi:MAG: DUF2911 domain-containing protein [Gemmatimonadetes bacterium]|nr:DUF2911 domain-containing protein [Gemmatimonadota bacterium]